MTVEGPLSRFLQPRSAEDTASYGKETPPGTFTAERTSAPGLTGQAALARSSFSCDFKQEPMLTYT